MAGTFGDKDFAAFAQSKWNSNAYNLERRLVKNKLLAFGTRVASRLFDTDGAPLLCEASSDHPAVWNKHSVEAQYIYFTRNEYARRELNAILNKSQGIKNVLEQPSPQLVHFHMYVRLNEAEVSVGIKLHNTAVVDFRNLLAKLEEDQGESFFEVARPLAQTFVFGRPGAAVKAPLTAEKLVRDIEEISTDVDAIWAAEYSLLRSSITTTKKSASQALSAMLDQCLPLYNYIAWTRHNDHIGLVKHLRGAVSEKRKRGFAENDRVRVVTGMFAGRDGIVQGIDSKGVLRVLIGRVPVRLQADEIERA